MLLFMCVNLLFKLLIFLFTKSLAVSCACFLSTKVDAMLMPLSCTFPSLQPEENERTQRPSDYFHAGGTRQVLWPSPTKA